MVALPHPTKLEGRGMLDSIHPLVCICLSVSLSVDGVVSAALLKFAPEFQFEIFCACFCGHGQKHIDFQTRHFQNGHLVPILDFRFPDCNLSLDLYINSKLQNYDKYV